MEVGERPQLKFSVCPIDLKTKSINMKRKAIPILSFPLAILVITVSITGLYTPGFYSLETANWQAQSIGQDMVDLYIIVPCLLITSILSYRDNKIAQLLWGGTLMYLIYTFVIYCFNLHFNRLFIVYCLTLGLSFYSFLYFMYIELSKPFIQYFRDIKPVIVTALFLIVIPILFYVLWLSDVLPAVIHNTVPKSLAESGLFTNPVHIIDLSVFLPGLFIVGFLMLRRKKLGYALAPVLLAFFVLMDITIAALVVVMKSRGLEGDIAVTYVMGALAIISLGLLVWYLRSLIRKPANVMLSMGYGWA